MAGLSWTLYPILASVLASAEPALPPGDPVGKAECVRRVDLRDFGAWVCRFGDLDGDGTADAVFVQTEGQQITCATAVDLDGKILWQRGTPDKARSRISSDAAVQIYDFDGDGDNEVLVIEGSTIRFLDGRTGKPQREAPVPGNDSILIANFTGAERPGDLLVKDRYANIWTFDNKLRPLWKASLNTGHYPMNVDVDRDGRDELVCGFTLFDHDGRALWSHPELPGHADAIDADDMDGDGAAEIAVSCCGGGPSVLLRADGKILFRKEHRHSQHAVIGAFVPERKGKQAVFVDRVSAYSADGGIVYCYLVDGTELWHTRPQGGLTIASTIDGWTGEPNRSFVCLYRRMCGPPVLVDGEGRQAAEFAFPPCPRSDRANQCFVQHFDALGDAREEVFVYGGEALWVYTNAAPAPAGLAPPRRGPDPRVYNASFYVGWQ
jgi:hypothetical protein